MEIAQTRATQRIDYDAAVKPTTGLYTIEPGDTLSSIAKRLGTSVTRLLELNPSILHPDRIYPGEVLSVPRAQTYTVQSGDTLSAIARNAGVSLTSIIELNQIGDPDRIYPGDQLLIPEQRTNTHHAEDIPTTPQMSAHPHEPTPPEKRTLEQADWQRAASALGVNLEVLQAVAVVESSESGFLPDGKPVILFEAHQFSKRTGHRFDDSHPDISSRTWDRHLYQSGSHEHKRLDRAKALDVEAALESASWGRFQIMGFNYREAGFDSVHAFVQAMSESESNQLDAFVHFIKANPALHEALQTQDWPTFARIYNGPGYAENQYDARIQQALEKLRIS